VTSVVPDEQAPLMWISVWRRLPGLAGGFFFIFVATMNYFLNYRKRRVERDALLDEAEKEERKGNIER
jgi:hypothetical protein